MKQLNNTELLAIIGGVTISGAFINSIASGITKMLDLGRSLGTAIRRVTGNNLCPIR